MKFLFGFISILVIQVAVGNTSLKATSYHFVGSSGIYIATSFPPPEIEETLWNSFDDQPEVISLLAVTLTPGHSFEEGAVVLDLCTDKSWIDRWLSFGQNTRITVSPKSTEVVFYPLQNTINPECSEIVTADGQHIPFDTFAPGQSLFDEIVLVEIPRPKDKKKNKNGNEQTGIPFSNLNPGQDYKPDYGLRGGAPFNPDFKPGMMPSNLVDISIIPSIIAVASMKEENGEAVLVLGQAVHPDNMVIEITNARGQQYRQELPAERLAELTDGLEDGDQLLSRLSKMQVNVRIGAVENTFDQCQLVNFILRKQKLTICAVSGARTCPEKEPASDNNPGVKGVSACNCAESSTSSVNAHGLVQSGTAGGRGNGGDGGDGGDDGDAGAFQCLLCHQMVLLLDRMSHRSTCPGDTVGMDWEPEPHVSLLMETPMEVEPETPPSPEHFTYQIDSEEQQNHLIGMIQQGYPDARIVWIKHPMDFEQPGLLQKIWINSAGTPVREPGLVQSSQKAVFVIDFRSMQPATIAELNQLFDTPAMLSSQRIGANKTIISVINSAMIPKSGVERGKPGNDFWRRIAAPDNLPEPEEVHELPQIYEGLPPGNHNSVIFLDFSRSQHWHQVLHGAIGLDKYSHITYFPGALSGFLPGGLVVLKGGDWSDPAFTTHIAGVMRAGQVELNGQFISLSGATFYRVPADKDIRQEVQENLEWMPSPDKDYALINRYNFNRIMSTAAVKDGSPVFHDVFGEILENASGLRITSQLSEHQWLELLDRVKNWRTESLSGDKAPVRVFVDPDSQQPEAFLSIFTDKAAAISATKVLVLKTSDNALPKRTIDENPPPLFVSITPETDVGALCGHQRIESYEHHLFSAFEPSDFLMALQQGTAIVMDGLHQNTRLQFQLESLLEQVPGLVINGLHYSFPQARIQVIVPDKAAFESPVWSSLPVTPAPSSSDKIIWEKLQQEFPLLHQMQEQTQIQIQQLKGMLDKIERFLPPSPCRTYPPWPQDADYPMLLKTVRQVQTIEEQYLPGVAVPEQEIWRKAIEVTLLEEYRGHPEVYEWLKWLLSYYFKPNEPKPDEPTHIHNTMWLDRVFFQKYLKHHPVPDREDIKNNLWQLMNRMGRNWFVGVSEFAEAHEAHINQVCKALLTVCPQKHQDRLVHSLGLSEPVELNISSDRDLDLEQKLATIIEGCQLPTLDEQQLWKFSQKIRPGIQPPNQIDTIKKVIKEYFPEADQKQLQDFSNAVTDNHAYWHQWGRSLENRLASLLEIHPLVFIKGSAGGGKSFTAEKVARRLNPHTRPIIFTATPGTNEESLFEHLVLVERSEPGDPPARQSRATTDKKTEMEQTPLSRWVVDNQPGSYKFMIVDEGNFPAPGTWNVLQGMFTEQPYIVGNGRKRPLSDLHRVIFTGNPESASGRKLDPFVRQHGVTLYYPPLPDEFLASQLVRPSLGFIEEQYRADAAQFIMVLWHHYKKILPEHEFTPRDLNEIIARMDFFWPSSPDGDISPEVINGLILRTFSESLGEEFPENERSRQESLNLWVKSHYAIKDSDNPLMTVWDQKFQSFFENLCAQAQGLELTGDASRALIYSLWQIFLRIIEEQATTIHSGKHATLIEGPAGRGKDRALDLLGSHFSLKTVRLNGGVADWRAIREAIEKAQAEGHIIILSEMNLIASEFLEGELNDVLTGSAASGFYLFATVNPGSFAGRRALSNALKSRFNHYRIADYSSDELTRIANSVWPEAEAKVRPLVDRHLSLRDQLVDLQITLQPATNQLVNYVRACKTLSAASFEQRADDLFQQHYGLYLKILEKNQPATPIASSQQLYVSETASHDAMLSPPWQAEQVLPKLYRQFPGFDPVMLTGSELSYYDPDSAMLGLPHGMSSEEALEEAYRMIIRHHWQKYGLPLEYQDAYDVLGRALYRSWQQYCSALWLSGDRVLAEAIFPMKDDETETLRLEHNKPWVREAEQLFRSTGCLPTKYHLNQLLTLLSTPLWQYQVNQKDQLTSAAQVTASQQEVSPEGASLPLALTLDKPRLFHVLSEGKGRGNPIKTKPVFPMPDNQKRVEPVRERHHLLELKQDDKQYQLQSLKRGSLGYDRCFPSLFNQNTPLTPGQICGTQLVTFSDKQPLVPLVGLQEFPYASLVSISEFGDALPCHVFRDRLTGQYLVHKPELSSRGGWVNFVLEKNQPLDTGDTLRSFSSPDTLRNICSEMLAYYPELRQRLDNKGLPYKEKAKIIQQFCSDFTGQETIQAANTIAGLKQILFSHNGISQHRSLTACVMCLYCGIPVRLVADDLNQYSCEITTDGQHWHPMDCGHYCPDGGKLVPEKVDRPELATTSLKALENSWVEDVSLEEFHRHLDIIKPGHAKFESFRESFPDLAISFFTESSDRNKGLLKLQNYLHFLDKHNPDHIQMVQHFLLEFERKVRERPSLEPLYFQIFQLIVIREKWSDVVTSPDYLSIFSQRPQYRQALFQKMKEYYKALTTPLVRGIDIQFTKKDELAAPDVESFIAGVAEHSYSPSFMKVLYQEQPAETFTDFSSGAFHVGRMVSGLPAFYKNNPLPLPSAVTLCLGRVNRDYSIIKLIVQRVEAPGRTPKNDKVITISMSHILSLFLDELLNRAFFKWFYQASLCKQQNLKVIFPAARYRKRDDVTDSPIKPGWLVPDSPEELQQLSLNLYYETWNHGGSVLSPQGITTAFSDSGMVVITPKQLWGYKAEFINGLPLDDIIKVALRSEAFKQYLHNEDEEKKEMVSHPYNRMFSYGGVINDIRPEYTEEADFR